MTNSSAPSVVLIAGRPSQCRNYQNAVLSCAYRCAFPSYPHMQSLSFDLLLLPGGGDISPALHGYPVSLRSDIIHCTCPDLYMDLLQLQLLRLAYDAKKPILGICKGMQLINIFLGGTLSPHLSTADMHKWTGHDQTHSVHTTLDLSSQKALLGFDTETALQLYRLLSSLSIVNSAHHQGIHQLGKNLTPLQCAEDGLPETIAHKYLPILGLQWHPERLPGFCPEGFGKLLNLLLHSA